MLYLKGNPYAGTDELTVHMLQNKVVIASAINTDIPFETTSMSAVVVLKPFDKVFVRLSSGTIYGRTKNHLSTFSGFYLGPANVRQNEADEIDDRRTDGPKTNNFSKNNGRKARRARGAKH